MKMNEIIFQENTPVTISLAKTMIRNHGKISIDPITYQMESHSMDSRLYIEDITLCDVELLDFHTSEMLNIIIEYQNKCYCIKNLYLFMEKIRLQNHQILCSLYFDNKIAPEEKKTTLEIESILNMDLLDYPLLKIKGKKIDMELSFATYEQFFKRSSISGIRPIYKEVEKNQNSVLKSPQIVDIFSGEQQVATLKVGQNYWDLHLLPKAQWAGA